jgi:hypothetical protein
LAQFIRLPQLLRRCSVKLRFCGDRAQTVDASLGRSCGLLKKPACPGSAGAGILVPKCARLIQDRRKRMALSKIVVIGADVARRATPVSRRARPSPRLDIIAD